jgi:hypothetical protein
MDDVTLKPLDHLPLKHQLYVLGYLHHRGDKTKAARYAGYSPKTCMEQGQQLYRKLQRYIEPLAKDLVRAAALSAEQVVQGLSLLASSDIRDYLTWDKENNVVLKNAHELTPAQAYCIESVEQHETQYAKTIKLRLAKKQPALDCLMEFHGQYRRRPQGKGLKVVFLNGPPAGAGPQQATVRQSVATGRRAHITFGTVTPATAGGSHAER